MSSDLTDETMDSVHVDTLLKARIKLGEKPITTVHIFERNDFFYLFQKDGEMAAQHIYGSVTATKSMGKVNPVSFCVLNHANFESILRHILLVKHYRVEIFKFVAAKGGKSAFYELEVRASPGNISSVEHVLYGESEIIRDCNYLVGVKVEGSGDQYQVGVAAIDTSLNLVQVCDLSDSSSFQTLESVLVQINPREIVIAQSENPGVKKVQTILERNRILVTHSPNQEFSPLSEPDIGRLFNTKSKVGALKENPLSSEACRASLNYLNLLAETDEAPKFRVDCLKPSDYMRIDQRTVLGLNLFDDNGSVGTSVFNILNRTRTPGGARMLRSWIKQPLIQADQIAERLDLVESFVGNSEARMMMHEDHLRKMPDFQRISTKFVSKNANLQDMYKVYVALGKLKGMKTTLESFGDMTIIKENFTKDIDDSMKDFDKFVQLVETTMDLDQVREGKFLVRPDFDDALGELREDLDSVETKIQRTYTSCANELALEQGKQLKLEHSVQHGYYFRLTMKDEKAVRNNRAYTVIEANKSGIKFRNGKLEELNDEHLDISRRYESQQSAIVREMVGIASGYADVMNHLGLLVSKLDVIVSLSLAAVCAPTPYTKPRVLPSTEKQMNFTELRHPIVELQENVSYIANDVDFQAGKSTFHIITGPNMGGKSTYIRSVGVAVLMGQIGSFVPAESACFSVIDSVMVRIGASDCQTKGISTFMAEMLEINNIIQNATANSLVLIDELGRGTSTIDGFGIAWGVSEHIVKGIGCFTLFTTHYTELTNLAEEQQTVKNYHVSALVSEEKLTLLYQIQPGVCDKSFGIHVAKLANFPADVIDEADKRLRWLESGSEPMSVE